MNKKFILLSILLILTIISFAQTNNKSQQLTIHIHGVYDAKISVSAYSRGVYNAPFSETPQVTGKVQITVPGEYLPGQFLLRMDYRINAEDQPYPSELVFFMNNHDLELKLNPLKLQPDSIDFGNDDENPVYFEFLKANGERRQQLILLEQLLVGYDSPGNQFYKNTKDEFEKRRVGYNKWIEQQELKFNRLFVSRLFAFNKVPPLKWDLPVEQQFINQASQYFDEINLGDELIVKAKAFDDFMSNYIAMFGRRVTNEAERDSMFTQAGRIACSKAAQGHPIVYGWVVDYFYRGYEAYGISLGMKMLEQHISNPNCLTSKKQEILRRLEGMEKLVEGTFAPPFEVELTNGMQVRFNGISKDKSYGLLVFYESNCSHCTELLDELKTWYENQGSSGIFDVISIAVDDDQENWKDFHLQQNFKWTDVWAPGGINSKVSNDYYILSTPAIFIIDKEMRISATLENFKEIEAFLADKTNS